MKSPHEYYQSLQAMDLDIYVEGKTKVNVWRSFPLEEMQSVAAEKAGIPLHQEKL